MECLINFNRHSSATLDRLIGCQIKKVEIARDLSQTAPKGLLAHAVYLWTDRGVFCVYGEAYRGLPLHDFASISMAEVSTDELSEDKLLREKIDEIDGKNQSLKFTGILYRRDMYAGTSSLINREMAVEYVCGLIFLFGETPISVLASSIEPSLEVLTTESEFSELLDQFIRVEPAW